MTTTENLGPITTSLALPESCANELDTVYKIPSLTTTWTVVEISGERTASVQSVGHPGGLNAFSIQVRFQSSDFASRTPTISSSAERTTSRVSTGPPVETSSDSSNSNAEQSTGIAPGATAGISVGVIVALLAIVGAIIIFMRRRRRELNPPQGSQPPIHEMGCDTETRFFEAPGKPVFDPRFPTYEIDGRSVAVENPGSTGMTGT
ncbi:hypothetical protein DL769_003580 [Monosporascus sp. CRB-8-3]|nr:hypothetical protein DL769_003580 [Monosporascus sp. CRB-8-3]